MDRPEMDRGRARREAGRDKTPDVQGRRRERGTSHPESTRPSVSRTRGAEFNRQISSETEVSVPKCEPRWTLQKVGRGEMLRQRAAQVAATPIYRGGYTQRDEDLVGWTFLRTKAAERRVESGRPTMGARTRSRAPRTCYQCGETDHLKADCPWMRETCHRLANLEIEEASELGESPGSGGRSPTMEVRGGPPELLDEAALQIEPSQRSRLDVACHCWCHDCECRACCSCRCVCDSLL